MTVASFVVRWLILLPSTLGEQVVWLSHVEAVLTAVWWLFWLAVDALVLVTVVDVLKKWRGRRELPPSPSG